ncbi:hypothetical protein BD769DRAFT_1393836 [Suillus cothurnatus]|nr:hypothetical protein BD769DRAFT_1393836 [Suillus cothurnatus]
MIPSASASPVTAFDCSIAYNCTLKNHFDIATMDEQLASFTPPDNLYDAVAHAWDSRNCPHNRGFGQKRPRNLASVIDSSPSDMGITWDRPGYRLRRTSYEERRGAVSVRPSEVNSLRPYTLSLGCDYFKALQLPSISLHSHESDSAASDGPIDIQWDDHPSDADDEMDDCGYSTDGTMSWQPHSVTQDPTPSLSSVSWSESSEDGYTSSSPDAESDDGYDEINVPPPCTPTSSNITGTRTAVTKKRRNVSASPRRSTKRRKYLKDEQKATTPKSHFSSNTFTPTYGTDDSEYEPSTSVKGRPAGPKQTLFPCLLDGCRQVCHSASDLARHRQCLRHRAPEYSCLGCRHPFTRPDALKRHLNGKPACKQAHRAALLASEA